SPPGTATCGSPRANSSSDRRRRWSLRVSLLARARHLLDEAHHERGPARLVRRAEARAGVAVEVFVEQHQIAPVGIAREPLVAAVTGPLPVRAGAGQER